MINISDLVRPNIKNLVPYTTARDDYVGDADIFLDANESPFGRYNRYPDPHQKALKHALAEVKHLDPQHLFLGNGSDEVIDLLYRIFCQPGKDKALIFTPTYGIYEMYARINDIALESVPLDKNFQIDTGKILTLLTEKRLKIIFLCSPNNPTGNTMHPEAITYLLEHFKGILVVDEAYIEFSPRASWAEKIEAYPNLVILQTLSKAWGAAGLRLGIGISNRLIISFLSKTKLPYNINTPNQQQILQKLQNKEACEGHVRQILAEKAKMQQILTKLPLIKHVYPSDTNFLLIKVHDSDAVYAHLMQYHVIVRNRNKEIKNTLRLTIGTPAENERLLAAFRAFST